MRRPPPTKRALSASPSSLAALLAARTEQIRRATGHAPRAVTDADDADRLDRLDPSDGRHHISGERDFDLALSSLIASACRSRSHLLGALRSGLVSALLERVLLTLHDVYAHVLTQLVRLERSLSRELAELGRARRPSGIARLVVSSLRDACAPHAPEEVADGCAFRLTRVSRRPRSADGGEARAPQHCAPQAAPAGRGGTSGRRRRALASPPAREGDAAPRAAGGVLCRRRRSVQLRTSVRCRRPHGSRRRRRGGVDGWLGSSTRTSATDGTDATPARARR